MSQIISVINLKGGVGKTTFTSHLSTGLTHLDRGAEYNPRILLIDLDPQCSLSISWLHEDRFENLILNQQIHTVKELFSAYFMSDTPHINPNDYILSSCVRKIIIKTNFTTTKI